MRLKILILPTFIILELILIIGYIKPNIDEIIVKKTEITTQKDALSRVDSVKEHIGAVNEILNRRRETVAFVEHYYPKVLDEERVVDMLNYLAQKSGTSVVEVNIKQNAKVVTVVEGEGVTDPSMSIDPSLLPELPLETPDSYEVQISVLGEYGNIKEFFNRVFQSDRLHTTKEFSISYRRENQVVEKTDDTASEGPLKNFLVGSMVVHFPYIKERHVANALNIAMFQSSEFDFTKTDELINFVTNTLPPLQAEGTGKTNPFE